MCCLWHTVNISKVLILFLMSVLDICRATGMEEDPEVTLDIQCLWRGGGAALTLTNNYFLHRRGSGSAPAIMV